MPIEFLLHRDGRWPAYAEGSDETVNKKNNISNNNNINIYILYIIYIYYIYYNNLYINYHTTVITHTRTHAIVKKMKVAGCELRPFGKFGFTKRNSQPQLC